MQYGCIHMHMATQHMHEVIGAFLKRRQISITFSVVVFCLATTWLRSRNPVPPQTESMLSECTPSRSVNVRACKARHLHVLPSLAK